MNTNINCPKCGKRSIPSKILYPVKEKNYNNDQFIKNEWDSFKKYLSRAYIFTIFGYGAPSSDVEAVNLMKFAWGDSSRRQYEQIEIIDISEEKALYERWGDFIHTHHYDVYTNYYESYAGIHPRRSCEAVFAQFMSNLFIDDMPAKPKFESLIDLHEYLMPRISVENSNR